MLDIDHFKAVNDRFGHAAGDDVLSGLVRAARQTLRSIDFIVRWGGEEFVVVLPDTDAPAAMIAAERLRQAMAATEVAGPGETPIRITVSIGVAVPTDDTPAGLLGRADSAMYAAKRGGRDQVVLAG